MGYEEWGVGGLGGFFFSRLLSIWVGSGSGEGNQCD